MIVLKSVSDAITLYDVEFPEEVILHGVRPKRNMNGLLRTQRRTPCRDKFSIKIILFSFEKYQEAVAFFKNNRGKQLTYTDWKETNHDVRLMNKITFEETSRHYRSITVELETV